VVERGRAARAELQATIAAKLDTRTMEHVRSSRCSKRRVGSKR